MAGFADEVCKIDRSLLYSGVFYRALVVGIVAFWLAMICLLVRMEWFSQDSESLNVPTAYLWKLMFLHRQPSYLLVYYQHQRVGDLRLEHDRQTPGAPDGAKDQHQLTAIGNFSADLPWMGRQNVALRSAVDLGAENTVRGLHATAVLRPPGAQHGQATTVSIEGQPETGVWHYTVRRDNEVLADETGTIAQLLDRPELRALGIDPAGLARMQAQQASRLSMTARHGHLRLTRDEIETYVVTLKDGSGLEATVHLNQLGQVLAVYTFAGVDLLDGALNP